MKEPGSVRFACLASSQLTCSPKMLPAKLLAAILPLFGPALVSGHGAMTWPPPRNGIDRDLSPWSGPAPNPTPSVESKTGWCPSVRILKYRSQACDTSRNSTPFATRLAKSHRRQGRWPKRPSLLLVLQRVRYRMRCLRRHFTRAHPKLKGPFLEAQIQRLQPD